MWERRDYFYRNVWMNKPDFNNQVEERVYDDGFTDVLADEKYICGIYVLDGAIDIYDCTIQKNSLLWIRGGDCLKVLMRNGVHGIFIETGRPLSSNTEWKVFKEEDIPWSRDLTEGMTASRHMIKAEDDGVKIQTCIYTGEFQHRMHAHTYAHLIYVLDGMLEQKSEKEDRIYGPSETALAPAGKEVLHTLAPGASFCHYLFIGDGIFDFIVDGKNIYAH